MPWVERGPDGNALPKYPKVGPAHKSGRARGGCYVCGQPATRVCEARHGWERVSIETYNLCGEHGNKDLRWKLVQEERASRLRATLEKA
jgi:3'-phosphoadenosine 5'-phosphosulfate sulfotransferase (PAPS reductase)/FAD synthetase